MQQTQEDADVSKMQSSSSGELNLFDFSRVASLRYQHDGGLKDMHLETEIEGK